jgi:hypothetical protein
LIEIFTTSILYLQSKVNNKNDWAVFCSSQRPNKIGQTAENDGAAIPLPIFFLSKLKNFLSLFHPIQTRGEQIMTTKLLLAPPLDFQTFLWTCAVDFLEINFEYRVSTIILRCQ